MEKHNTEQDFIAAFWQLYEKMPAEKISVRRLCQLAGYNRTTFYNHFENIYDLLDKAVYQILAPVKEDVLSVQNLYTLLQKNLIGSILFTYFQRQDRYIELLFKRRNYHILSGQIKKEFLLYLWENRTVSDETYERIKILLEYQISAVLGVINYWYEKGKTISEQEILQRIYAISEKGVLNSLKAELKNTCKQSGKAHLAPAFPPS